MKSALAVLTLHALRTLPDSLRYRRTVLLALETVPQAGNPVRQDVRAQLAALAAVNEFEERLRSNLSAGGME